MRLIAWTLRAPWVAALLGAFALAGIALGWQVWDAKAAVSPGATAGAEALRLGFQDETPSTRLASPADLSGSAEGRLLSAYRLVGEKRLDAALQVSAALVQDYPNFRLGLLLYADLLAAHAEPLVSFGSSGKGAETSAPPEAVKGLREEALARLRGMAERPPPGALPAEFIRLPASTPLVIAVDARRSRLYLFRNDGSGLHLVDDFYVSLGKQGVDKRSEGDQRTPLGVYHTLGRVETQRLDERFGSGALSLNYPNAYDRNVGRTGSGILLHGVPTNTYARPPLDSDGCVAMSNEDVQRLAAQLPERNTPVVITREIHWVAKGGRAEPDLGFNAAWAQWRTARLHGEAEVSQALYAEDATLPTNGKAALRFKQRLGRAAESLDEVSILTWLDEQPNRVVTFIERAQGEDKRDRWVRQYWRADAHGTWRIVAEGPLG